MMINMRRRARSGAPYLVALLALVLGACASPQLAPRFDAPSTVPIEQAHNQIKTDLESAKKHTAQIKDKCPQAESLVAALSSDLDGANSALQTSEGARLQLKTQLQQQTEKANGLADSYDKQGVEVTGLKATVKLERAHVHKLKFYIIAVAALLGIFIAWRLMPLLAMAGPYGIAAGFVGIPGIISTFLWLRL